MTFWKKENEKVTNQPLNPLKTELNKVMPELTTPPQTPAQLPLSEEEKLAARYGKVRSALGAGTIIQGKLSFDTPVSIDGKLSGEIFSSEALIVGPSGSVDAQVEVKALIVSGVVRGKIVAKERIELLSGGRIEGTIQTPSLRMEEGSTLNAKCAMNTAQTRIITLDSDEASKKSREVQPEKEKAEKDSPKPEQHASLH